MSILKELREEHKKEQKELAEYLGISAPNYSKKEAGQVRFSLVEAKKLSEFFGLSIDEIFFNNEVSRQKHQEGKKLKLIEKEIEETRKGFERFVAQVEKWLEETDPERKEDHE